MGLVDIEGLNSVFFGKPVKHERTEGAHNVEQEN
jgi:hypothetical protein